MIENPLSLWGWVLKKACAWAWPLPGHSLTGHPRRRLRTAAGPAVPCTLRSTKHTASVRALDPGAFTIKQWACISIRGMNGTMI